MPPECGVFGRSGLHGMVPPSITRTQYGEGFYQIYFQRPGVADVEFARDIPDTFRRLLVGASGDNPDGREPRPLVIPEGRGLLDMMPVSPTLPAWLSEDDIRAYSEDFALHGDRAFTDAFNWYRNMELNNELLAPFRGRRVEAPALYVVGDRDMVTSLRGPDSGPSLYRDWAQRRSRRRILPEVVRGISAERTSSRGNLNRGSVPSR